MDCDVLIAGGSFVGLSLGLGLARAGLAVVVVEPVDPAKALGAGFDGRVSALSYASLRLFRSLGAGEGLEAAAQPINRILVTDAKRDAPPSPFSLFFDGEELGGPLGAIAENRAIRQVLFAAAEAQSNLTVIAPDRVAGVQPGESKSHVQLASGAKITAHLVVAADGRDSLLRQDMGIGTVGWSYGQDGIVATVAHDKPHDGTAYEHFLPSGPFAILPLPGNRSSLVWTEKTGDAKRLMQSDDATFQSELSRRFGTHLGAVSCQGPRWSYPLRFHLARAYVAKRFALAGDSAHGIHPIAGQGLNLGLKDAAALVDVIVEAAGLGQDIGAPDVLKRYERWRRFDSFQLALTMDGLNRLFANDIAPLRLARDLGMGLVDKIGPLRRYFMREAGGDTGKLPSLMQA